MATNFLNSKNVRKAFLFFVYGNKSIHSEFFLRQSKIFDLPQENELSFAEKMLTNRPAHL